MEIAPATLAGRRKCKTQKTPRAAVHEAQNRSEKVIVINTIRSRNKIKSAFRALIRTAKPATAYNLCPNIYLNFHMVH